jgi:biopolymer transport protein ExbD
MKLKGWPEQEDNEPISITPSINIALILVLIFLTGASQIFMRWLMINIPRVRTQVTKQELKSEFKVNIYLKDDQTVYVNEEPVKYKDLPQLITELLARSKTRLVLVSAHPRVSHGAVVDILDLSRQCGAGELVLLRRKK